LTDNKVRVLLQTGDRRDPELPDVPLVTEFALDETKLEIQKLWLTPLDTARPFAMPPDVRYRGSQRLRRDADGHRVPG
jgi:hypothetical protein